MSRHVPECHLTIGPSSTIEESDGERFVPVSRRYTSDAAPCLGSRCSAFLSTRSPTDPLARLGTCGLVHPGAEPWPDPNPTEDPDAP